LGDPLKGYKRYLTILILSCLLITIGLLYAKQKTMMEALNHFCRIYNIDERVMYSLIQEESDGVLDAVSDADCWGLGGISERMARRYYYHRANKISYFTNIALLPKSKLKRHMLLLYPNIGASCHAFRHCLDQSKNKFGEEVYLYAIHLYLNGYTDNISWRYYDRILDRIVRFGYKEIR